MQHHKRSCNYATAESPRWSIIGRSKWRTREIKGNVMNPYGRVQKNSSNYALCSLICPLSLKQSLDEQTAFCNKFLKTVI